MSDTYLNLTELSHFKTNYDAQVTARLLTKQDELVSGVNIKTVNNQSILGSGNVNVTENFLITCNQTTHTEIKTAMDNNLHLLIRPDAETVSEWVLQEDYDEDAQKATFTIWADTQHITYILDWSTGEEVWTSTTSQVQKKLVAGDGINIDDNTNTISVNLPIDTVLSSTSTNLVQNSAIKNYVDINDENLQNQINALGEPFRVKQIGGSNYDISVPFCTENISNTQIPNLDISITGDEATEYMIVGMLGYEMFNSGGQRINCWPVCQFTMNNQATLRVRMMCAGSGTIAERPVITRVICFVLLKHR